MRTILIASMLAVLAACAQGPAGGSVGGGEAGGDPGWAFGNATLNNALVQSGERDAAQSLAARFAATVPTAVTFAFDSAALDAEAQRVLAAQAAFIRSFPEVRFAVTGHADRVGPGGYNYDLGLRRARAAVAFLVAQGVDAARLEALVSVGETEPVVATDSPERRNRRAVTTIRGFVQSHPSVLNGKYAEIVFREYVASATTPSGFNGGGGGGAPEGGGEPAAE